MEKISLTKYREEHPNRIEARNIHFIVDSTISIGNGYANNIIDGCTFEFKVNGSLHIENSDLINNCNFYGIENADGYKSHSGKLVFAGIKEFTSNSISEAFKMVVFRNIDKFLNLVDSSYSVYWTIQNVDIIDSEIEGKCDNLSISNCKFKSLNSVKSVWNKEIFKEATCIKTIFDTIKINPFYLATRCDDKSSLDLSRATLIDDWSRLRKKYSGMSLFIILILTFLYFLPFIFRIFRLIIASNLKPLIDNLEKLKMLEKEFHFSPLWKVLFWENYEHILFRILFILLTAALLLYNVGRFWLTLSIAKLREEERFLSDSNFQLVSIHPDKLKKQLVLDKRLDVLFWISVAYSIFNLIHTFFIKVPVI